MKLRRLFTNIHSSCCSYIANTVRQNSIQNSRMFLLALELVTKCFMFGC